MTRILTKAFFSFYSPYYMERYYIPEHKPAVKLLKTAAKAGETTPKQIHPWKSGFESSVLLLLLDIILAKSTSSLI